MPIPNPIIKPCDEKASMNGISNGIDIKTGLIAGMSSMAGIGTF